MFADHDLLSGAYISPAREGRSSSPSRRPRSRSPTPPAAVRKPEPAIEPTTTATTTSSVDRNFSDLDGPTFVAFAAALCAARTVVQQPLNLALTRKQTCAVASSMSTAAVLRRIVETEGGWRRGLGQGAVPLVLGCAISEAIYLGLFEYGREVLPFGNDVSRDVASGYAADVACRCVHIPFSVVAFRMMTAHQFSSPAATAVTARRGMLATLRGVHAEGGARSVFAGLGATLVVGCQWTAVWWAGYAQCKLAGYAACDRFLVDADAASPPTRLPRWVWARGDNLLINSAASIVTSAATAVLFNPFLVVRTRLQVTPHARLMPTVRAVMRESGPRGFYHGTALNVASCVIDGFLASTSYEYAKLWSDRSRCA